MESKECDSTTYIDEPVFKILEDIQKFTDEDGIKYEMEQNIMILLERQHFVESQMVETRDMIRSIEKLTATFNTLNGKIRSIRERAEAMNTSQSISETQYMIDINNYIMNSTHYLKNINASLINTTHQIMEMNDYMISTTYYMKSVNSYMTQLNKVWKRRYRPINKNKWKRISSAQLIKSGREEWGKPEIDRKCKIWNKFEKIQINLKNLVFCRNF